MPGAVLKGLGEAAAEAGIARADARIDPAGAAADGPSDAARATHTTAEDTGNRRRPVEGTDQAAGVHPSDSRRAGRDDREWHAVRRGAIARRPADERRGRRQAGKPHAIPAQYPQP